MKYRQTLTCKYETYSKLSKEIIKIKNKENCNEEACDYFQDLVNNRSFTQTILININNKLKALGHETLNNKTIDYSMSTKSKTTQNIRLNENIDEKLKQTNLKATIGDQESTIRSEQLVSQPQGPPMQLTSQSQGPPMQLAQSVPSVVAPCQGSMTRSQPGTNGRHASHASHATTLF